MSDLSFTEPAAAAATGVAVAAVIVGLVVVLASRRLSVGLPVFLDLLLAAGLLRLSAGATWDAIVAAAAIVAIRKVVTFGIGSSRGVALSVDPTSLRRALRSRRAG